jgi:ZIP family zinc transporter
MNNVLKIVIYSSFAGLPIIIGGLISSIFQNTKISIKEEVNNWIIAFAGGALLSAISFALIPKAIAELNYIKLIIIFLSGTFTFMLVDIMISKSKSSLAQVISMMMDFLPESLALGASFAHNHKFGLLLAIFIGLQNLPEGFNSYIELRHKMKHLSTLILMFSLSFTGIIAALLGSYFLSNNPELVDIILLYAGGGILYLIFQDIAPLAKNNNEWIPATGASFGFLIGMIGEKVLG